MLLYHFEYGVATRNSFEISLLNTCDHQTHLGLESVAATTSDDVVITTIVNSGMLGHSNVASTTFSSLIR